MENDMAQVDEVHVVSEEGGPVTEHLTPLEVAAYVEGTASPDTRARILTHVTECHVCRDEIVDVSRIASRMPAPRARRARAVAWIPAIAAVLVFILVRPTSSPRVSPQHREPPVTSTVLPMPLAPVGLVDSIPLLLWTAVPNADHYGVRLFAADGSLVWEQDTNDTTLRVPPTVHVQGNRPYYWRVEAQTGIDRHVTSELVEFLVPSSARQ
jgi:putative zinc finger protein